MSADREGFLHYVDDQGVARDAAIHEEIVDDPDASRRFHLLVIRDSVADGHTLDASVAVFGTDELRRAHREGRLAAMLDALPSSSEG